MGRVFRVIASAAAAVLSATFAFGQSEPPSLAELQGQLELEREKGVTCAGFIKGYGAPTDQIMGRMEYSSARAAFNATIENLSVALIMGEGPGDVGETFQTGVSHREALCEHAMSVVPDMTDTKSPLMALLGSGILGDASKLLDSVGTFRKTMVEEDEVRMNALVSRLEAKKWPSYDDLSAQR